MDSTECASCGSENLVEENIDSREMVVCQDCGRVVVDESCLVEQQADGTGRPPSTYYGGGGGGGGGGGFDQLCIISKRLYQREKTVEKTIKNIIDAMGSKLKLPEHELKNCYCQGVYLWKNPDFRVVGRGKRLFCASILFLACRRIDPTTTFNETAATVDVDVKLLGRMVKILSPQIERVYGKFSALYPFPSSSTSSDDCDGFGDGLGGDGVGCVGGGVGCVGDGVGGDGVRSDCDGKPGSQAYLRLYDPVLEARNVMEKMRLGQTLGKRDFDKVLQSAVDTVELLQKAHAKFFTKPIFPKAYTCGVVMVTLEQVRRKKITKAEKMEYSEWLGYKAASLLTRLSAVKTALVDLAQDTPTLSQLVESKELKAGNVSRYLHSILKNKGLLILQHSARLVKLNRNTSTPAQLPTLHANAAPTGSSGSRSSSTDNPGSTAAAVPSNSPAATHAAATESERERRESMGECDRHKVAMVETLDCRHARPRELEGEEGEEEAMDGLDSLSDLDNEELDQYINSIEEVKEKEQLYGKS